MSNRAKAEIKRIGIVTLHYGFNEGAILQAYALACLIKEYSPHCEVEIIDQRYPNKLAIYGKAKNPREVALQKAINTWLPLSKKKFVSQSHNKAFSYINEECEVLVAGSDVLWNKGSVQMAG